MKNDTIYVKLIDYDNCGDNAVLINEEENTYDVDLEHPIVKTCFSENKTYISVGSLRQTHRLNYSNMNINGNGNCFINYSLLADWLNSEVDEDNFVFSEFLFGDMLHWMHYDNKTRFSSHLEFFDRDAREFSDKVTPGRTLNLSLADEPKYIWVDNNKILTIISHAHYYANMHPDSEISIEFFDDSSYANEELENEYNRWLLEYLQSVFIKNPELLPNNVTLTTICYAGGMKELKQVGEPIRGKGECLGLTDLARKIMPQLEKISGKPLYDEGVNQALSELSSELKLCERNNSNGEQSTASSLTNN